MRGWQNLSDIFRFKERFLLTAKTINIYYQDIIKCSRELFKVLQAHFE
jgi:hypothetical protein